MIKTLAIVVPVLDDWPSFAALVAAIAGRAAGTGVAMHICAVDDGSLVPFDIAAVEQGEAANAAATGISGIEIVRLALNLGHQRAIAVGLSLLVDRPEYDAVLVMDGDGEDRPDDIPLLLAAGRSNPGAIVVAGRAKRSEPAMFRLWYRLYRFLFYLLTGQAIRFGNFSLLPMPAVRRLVYMPELWNNLAASIMRSRIPYVEVPTVRGSRFAGRSRMNLVALIVHGLSALSVNTDMIFVRVLLAAVAIAVAAGCGIVAVAVLRFGTRLVVPGWATTAAGDLLIILLQTLVVIVAATLTMLAGRSNRPIVPIADAGQFVAERKFFEILASPAVPQAQTAAAAAAAARRRPVRPARP